MHISIPPIQIPASGSMPKVIAQSARSATAAMPDHTATPSYVAPPNNAAPPRATAVPHYSKDVVQFDDPQPQGPPHTTKSIRNAVATVGDAASAPLLPTTQSIPARPIQRLRRLLDSPRPGTDELLSFEEIAEKTQRSVDDVRIEWSLIYENQPRPSGPGSFWAALELNNKLKAARLKDRQKSKPLLVEKQVREVVTAVKPARKRRRLQQSDSTPAVGPAQAPMSSVRSYEACSDAVLEANKHIVLQSLQQNDEISGFSPVLHKAILSLPMCGPTALSASGRNAILSYCVRRLQVRPTHESFKQSLLEFIESDTAPGALHLHAATVGDLR